MLSTQTKPRKPIQEVLNAGSGWQMADMLNKGKWKEIHAQQWPLLIIKSIVTNSTKKKEEKSC